jgi:NAD(P)-dependent dehydrogenase (short-subunit alcohol dehydrogenase family)
VRPLALVTGGCHRLGGAIAAELARRGWNLALHGHRQAEPEPAVAAALAEAGARWTVSVADFADPSTAPGLLDEVCDGWGRAPRLLVNSASLFGQDRLEDATAAALIDNYAVNCAAPVLLTRAFAERAGEGAIVNLLDQRVAHPHGDQLGYTLAKVALAAFTRIAARELAPRVRVNAVAPGLTLPGPEYGPKQMKALAGLMPLERLPTPADIARAVAYLVEAPAVTGQVLYVDAGASLEIWRRDFVNL